MTTTDYEPNVVLATVEFDTIGTRPIRHDGVDKVTGRAQYGADFQASDLLHGKILRSPHAHARIISIDTSKAEAYPGVKAVVTAADFPAGEQQGQMQMGEISMSLRFMRDNVLASKKVLYPGHPVAGVAAVNAHVAEEAINFIDVEYEVLEPVPTVLDAIREGAPLLHDDLKTEEFGQQTDKVSNIASHFQHTMGDVEKAFVKADYVVEREFDTKTVHQGYIELHNATAFWNRDGRVTIWCSTQGPFEVRDATAGILGLDVSQVNLVPMEIGGGFGGKFEPYGDPVAALLSKKTGHPVKIVMTRLEEIESTGPTPGSYIKVKMGASKEGKIVAAQAYMAYEAGAYPGSPIGAGALCIFGPYDIPNVLIDGLDVVVNKPKTAAYRAPGATNASFASETIVDELAAMAGMDPLDFRINNASREGTRRADSVPHPKVGCIEVLQAMKDHPHWNAPLEGENRGRGVGLGFWMNFGGPASCTIKVNADGTVALREGSPDIGGTRTTIAMQAAEALGISAESVVPGVVDTDSVGYTNGTGGSSVTFKQGLAAHEAAQHVKQQMIARAATIWAIEPDSIKFEKGVLFSESDPELKMTFAELASKIEETGEPIVGVGNVQATKAGASFAGSIADVEVDTETGKVKILRFTMIQDVGKAVHPSYVEGQLQGGGAQGIGWAMNEEYFLNDKGQVLNSSLLDYRLPTSLDLPMIDTVIVEVPNPGHPFGVRGVGEANIIPPAGALGNAIANAVGIRMDVLPMNPTAIRDAIGRKG